MTGEQGPKSRYADTPGPGGRPSRVQAEVTSLRTRAQKVEQTQVGALAARLKSADLINQGMTFAALVLLVFFPTAITLAALSPDNSEGAGTFVIRSMGLSGDAAAAVERLFAPHGGTVLSGWTLMSAVWLVVGALALAGSLQGIYVRIWGLDSPGLRGVGAQALWVCSLVVLAAALTGLGKVLTGSVIGQVGYGCLFVAGSFLFIWFSIRLLGGGLGWRRLLPTAVFTTIGLLGLGGFSMIFFSSSIVSNDKSYGSIGVVFIILSWLIGVGVVVMGGAVMGAWYEAAGLSFTRGVRRLSGKGGNSGGKQSPAQADDVGADAAGSDPAGAGGTDVVRRGGKDDDGPLTSESRATDAHRRAVEAAAEHPPMHDTQDFVDADRGFVATSAAAPDQGSGRSGRVGPRRLRVPRWSGSGHGESEPVAAGPAVRQGWALRGRARHLPGPRVRLVERHLRRGRRGRHRRGPADVQGDGQRRLRAVQAAPG